MIWETMGFKNSDTIGRHWEMSAETRKITTKETNGIAVMAELLAILLSYHGYTEHIPVPRSVEGRHCRLNWPFNVVGSVSCEEWWNSRSV